MTEHSESSQRRPPWRRWWIWGIIASVLVGVIPLFLASDHGQAFLLAFLVVLTGTILTFLLEPIIRFDDVTHRVLETVSSLQQTLSTMNAPPSLQQFTISLLDDWRSVEGSGYQYLSMMFQATTEDTITRIHSIAQGKVDGNRTHPINFRSADLHMFRDMKVVHTKNLDYWNTPHGLQYLAKQSAAIAHGSLTVERIIVIDANERDTKAFEDAVRSQIRHNIRTKILIKDEVPHGWHDYLEDDFTVVTEQGGKKMLVRPTGAITESISTTPGDIGHHEHIFTQLRDYSRSPSEFFPDL